MVRFENPSVLEVLVPGYAGSPFENRLRLSALAGSGSGAQEIKPLIRLAATSDRQIFERIAPGECVVVVEVKTDTGRWHTVGTNPITLRSGENSLTLRLPHIDALGGGESE